MTEIPVSNSISPSYLTRRRCSGVARALQWHIGGRGSLLEVVNGLRGDVAKIDPVYLVSRRGSRTCPSQAEKKREARQRKPAYGLDRISSLNARTVSTANTANMITCWRHWELLTRRRRVLVLFSRIQRKGKRAIPKLIESSAIRPIVAASSFGTALFREFGDIRRGQAL